ncbi:1,4-dihydroxy-2-naphthoate polyprenyltransferase [Solihabitans fulvus]|uniref:1,4-dihydroxy-2-naphthoate octaprenyltransferase n=1 Tax=Solihabitans fulvus TaxID=1892852 RepID=A0A5B2XPM8_9PSEU|nr:1,4-dihydroxy-2-naphthoate polyprenyltransferase [Solihabitans fulvus]KAA2264822.1 1,4-dihydroxy-2-naphthoate polyprenyltransferase [Solihabitans fulvus]
MATVAQWVEGARPRTLPNSISPVLVGAGAAHVVGGFDLTRTLLALVVSLTLQLGVNYANDYSDGIRGTDANRVGPFRLVGSGSTEPKKVRNAAFGCFGLAAVAGLALVVLSGHWWLLAVGLVCIAAAWFYTGGTRPYGYAGFGEIAVFVFFGLVGVLGTVYVQAGQVGGIAIGCAVAVGSFSAAVLVANNLRDIPTDKQSGKRTLAVLLGDADTRHFYLALLAVPLVITALVSLKHHLALAGLLAIIPAVPAVRRVTAGRNGRDLIPVLRDTGLAMLLWSAATGVALVLS